MSEYNMTHTGKELDDAIAKVLSGYIDKSSISHFATGVVNNVTAGQEMTVTGIKDAVTKEAFDIKGVLAYIQFTKNSWAYPENHAGAKPAVFCFVRDNSRRFGTAIACGAQDATASYIREVRFNTDIGGVSSPGNTYITFSSNSFTYISSTKSMYGLLAASQWRWVAWG